MNRLNLICTAGMCLALLSCSQNSRASRKIYGQIEVDEIDVASRIPARVRSVQVRLGQPVKAGEPLVLLEDDVISAKRKQAEALLAAAESKNAIAQDAVRPEEKEQLKAAVSAAKKQMDFAKSSLQRAEVALKEGAISQQALDEIRFKAQAARENYNAIVAKQRMANTGARAEEKAGAAALLEQARSGVAEAEAYSKDMNLVSPIDGEVFQILNHEGELVPAGYPVVTLLKTSEMWVNFQVPETELSHFPMGQTLRAKIPALEDREISAKVSFISPMAGFANAVSTQDRGTLDLKTFELRATLEGQTEALRPGMTVLIERP